MSHFLFLLRRLFYPLYGFISSLFERKEKMIFPIDFVVLWLDDSDPEWQKSRDKYMENNNDNDDRGNERYRDWDIFKYWFRSVELYAPWVHKVYLITCGHYPSWLNMDHPKLVHVKHGEYMNADSLPTFNSSAIEINIHRIESLQEHFVLFNDDMFLNNHVSPEDFFRGGIPVCCNVASPLVNSPQNELFPHMKFGMIGLMNEYDWVKKIEAHPEKWFNYRLGNDLRFNLETYIHGYLSGFHFAHMPQGIRKSTMLKVWEKYGLLLERTSMHRFRVYSDITQWIFTLYEIVNGSYYSASRHSLGIYRRIEEIDKIKNDLQNAKINQICINDTPYVKNFEIIKESIIKLLDNKFPNKCSFEK